MSIEIGRPIITMTMEHTLVLFNMTQIVFLNLEEPDPYYGMMRKDSGNGVISK